MATNRLKHNFTSTGLKFWHHPEQMQSYREGTGHTVISTHISPEGACNLDCDYCSVAGRSHTRIELEVIKDYVKKLRSRGLKAIIVTGGGEPLLYPSFDELISWLHNQGLKIGLITNGTLDCDVWPLFTWVRVSINLFEGWEKKISIPVHKLHPGCTVGLSAVYTNAYNKSVFLQVARKADALQAQYVRFVPNCLIHDLTGQHRSIDRLIAWLDDDRFFNQHKTHRTPLVDTCHQAYFRPYLSEEPWHEDGVPGTVYPCDSLVLNDAIQCFDESYQICRASDVLDFLDGKIPLPFSPRERCNGCVFTSTMMMLDEWKEEGVRWIPREVVHEEFV